LIIMPLPKPRNKEKKSEFVSRCISELTDKKEFKTQDQRIAVCYSQFEEAKASADLVVNFGNDEFIYSAFKKAKSYLDDKDEEGYECEKCGYEGEKAEKCPKCGSSDYKYEKEDDDDDDDGEEVNSSNVYVPVESEYVNLEEVSFEEAEITEIDIFDTLKNDSVNAAEYQGKKVKLNKPFRTPDGPKKFAVYVKNQSGNVVIVRFGDPSMKIKKNIPARRKSFRARHNCDNPGPKYKARYWACKSW
jgi:predicted Zn-ribbon and HTH transcriptional regulator